MIPKTPLYGAQRRNISPPSEWIVAHSEVGHLDEKPRYRKLTQGCGAKAGSPGP
jgi:hypothetical protein